MAEMRSKIGVCWLRTCLGALTAASCLLANLPMGLRAQDTVGVRSPATRDISRIAVIGLRTGAVDPGEVRAELSDGAHLIRPSGNGKPFQVLNFTSDWIEIRLTAEPADPQLGVTRVAYRFFPSEESLYRALLLNQVDFAVLSDQNLAEDVARNSPDLFLFPRERAANTIEMVAFNLTDPITRSRAVRQAIAYAIPINRIIRKILFDKAERARGSVFEPDKDLFPGNLEDYGYSRKRAIETLERAGWRDTNGDGIRERRGRPLQVQLAYREGLVVEEKIAREILLACVPLGIEINPVKKSRRALRQQLYEGSFQAVLWEHHFSENIESLHAFFSHPETSFIKFSKPAYDGYYESARRGADPGHVRLLAQGMQRVLSEECVAAFLMFKWYDFVVINTGKFDLIDRQTGGLKTVDQWQFTEPGRLP